MNRIVKKEAHFWQRVIYALLIILLTGCSAGQTPPASGATATIESTPTTISTSTPRPTATVTPLPDLHEGPFTWSGGERPLLMAHYMPWYQNKAVSGTWGYHWSMNHFTPTQKEDGTWENFASHYTPLIGLYDLSDEAVLEYQVLLMKLSGIDGVIVDWYGTENFWDYGSIHASTQKLFEAVKKAGLKFVICYEDQTIKHMVDNKHFTEEMVIPRTQQAMAFMQENWFNDDAYLKVDGQPVLMNFGPQYFKSGDGWSQVFSVLEPKPLFITLDNAVVKQAQAGYPWPPMWASSGGILSHDALKKYFDDFYDKAEDWDYMVGGAFPGFHDIYKEAEVSNGYGFLDALEGKTFRFTMQEALNQTPDMVQLITWNDYGEGTNIEPTVEYGYQYLEMVQEARKVTGGDDFAFTSEDLLLAQQLYDLRVKYAEDAAVMASLDEASSAIAAGDLTAAKEVLGQYP